MVDAEPMRFPPGRLLVSLLVIVVCLSAIAGCGGSGDSNGTSASPPSQAALISWPLFGRVPERTHYLPAKERFLDPPLKEAWSINTHALIEFPPAIADGVAYVVNKYGNAKAVRLSDRKILWERNTNPKDAGKPTDVTGPVYYEGKVFFADVDGNLVAVDAKSGAEVWKRKLVGHLESSPMAVGGTLYLGTDKTNVVAVRASDGKVLWQFNSPAAIKASPSFHDGRLYVADYESGVFCLDAKNGRLIWRTNTSKAPPFGEEASSPRRRSPSVASTPPATTAPSSPSTKRVARSTGPSRPTTSSTALRPSPMYPAHRRASISAPTTSTSMPSTRAAASSAGATTSAARYLAHRP